MHIATIVHQGRLIHEPTEVVASGSRLVRGTEEEEEEEDDNNNNNDDTYQEDTYQHLAGFIN